MALIKCPECGKEVSSKAASCPNCGCPLSGAKANNEVKIQMPNNIAVGAAGLFSKRYAVVTTRQGRVLWEGKHGQCASFEIAEPKDIIVDLGGWANKTQGTIYPGKRYSLVQEMGVHMLATYMLSEVDRIDSEPNRNPFSLI